MEKQTFLMLADLNVSEKVEKRDGLSYLSWAWAWRHFKEACPDAIYEIIINQQTGLPYFESAAGVMVYTKVTACGETHMMWLPVMDSHNKAMKAQPYEIKTKNSTIFVKAFDMFDVNKTIMRCLTKNLAMFGLGLYIYAGEDLPDGGGEHVVFTRGCGGEGERLAAQLLGGFENVHGVVGNALKVPDGL